MDKKTYRALLPASVASQSGGSPTSSESSLKKKRAKLTKVACNTCRAKKTACDGNRPTCTSCQRRHSKCVYTSKDELETPTMVLKRENDALRQRFIRLNELIHHLRYMPEDVAQVTLQKLRTTSDPINVLHSTRRGMMGGCLSEQTVVCDLPLRKSLLNPPPIVRQQFFCPELDAVDNHSRPPGLPSPAMSISTDIDTAKTLPANELVSAEPFSQSSITSAHNIGTSAFTSIDSCPGRNTGTSTAPFLNDPRLSARYIDPRLNHLNIAFWTTVPVTNTYAAEVISSYLETVPSILGLFEAHQFIDDFINYQFNFCRPFLVSALLAVAFQEYASKQPDATARSYEFEAEAEKLWLDEKASDSLPALAGLALLFQSFGIHGRSESGKTYLNEYFEMAKRMRLFGLLEAET